ncbi:MAG TPA: hypothetical protein VMU57_13585 [Edaphobacter sp.]|uniref:hypothetical protein n=1 Tax=Edaphobacter sp. TaxID=1934404 RepID=UPI002BDC4AB8|nr:hypothetical protein [Edaphobacter sp.]HUZ95934.1 hypothetical protein [Edaphobacter sp.]
MTNKKEATPERLSDKGPVVLRLLWWGGSGFLRFAAEWKDKELPPRGDLVSYLRSLKTMR